MNGIRKISKKRLLALTGTSWLFDALDVGILSFIIAALEKDWHLSAEQMGWIGSVNSIGMAIGAFVFGALADRFGRKQIFLWTLLFFSVGSGLSAFSQSFIVFIIFRLIVGMGLGGELPVASTLVSESVEVKDRGRIVVLLESFWAVGWILSALIAYFIIPKFGWQIALILTALPAFYTLYLRKGLPDSPQFLAKKQNRGEASIFVKIAQVWSKEFAARTCMLWILWFSVVFSYYGMFLWLPSVIAMKGFDLIHSFGYVLIMTIAQLPGYFTAAWLIEKAGRKFVLVTFLIGTAISAYWFGHAESVLMLIISGMLLSFFDLGAWGALYAYSPEQYPTAIRGTGTGMAAAFGRIGGILGPLLVGTLVARHIPTAYIFTIFCLSIFVGVLFLIFLGKETKAGKLSEEY
ncbi:MFS transporter [Bacillus ginsengihumi]|uniref:MFS transporter n=1 Tax=Heyndrickxia ginsengihumi TaxID=363870 RepID=A0A0A6VB46_9BACI|nr:MFS transporter [Heyndrickxia ginsengihumi]KHD85485.1 major facilitator transporter [Heyndrickxia ginsengihumi]NEY20737.1 MFS transporter [Heyndrickxia ginsengihumi]